MLYILFEYLGNRYSFPGDGLYKYISFRSALIAISAILISTFVARKLIQYFKEKNIVEDQREYLGFAEVERKKKTPTMGGFAILAGILVPVLLFTDLRNIYIQLLLFTSLSLGLVGFIDDFIKTFRSNKDGLKPVYKTIGQMLVGGVVGITLSFHPDVFIGLKTSTKSHTEDAFENIQLEHVHSYKTTVPFLKNNEIDYKEIVEFFGMNGAYTWILFVFIVIFVITATSNASNLTDGLDGLSAGISSFAIIALGAFAYLSGNYIFSSYLNIPYIPHIGELALFCSAYLGACIGFLWYNAYPAQIFMGDTGSLTLGGNIAVLAFSIRKELMIPLICGVFVVENLSVVLQVLYFKFTKRRYGQGKRIFLCAPLHHHFQKKGLHESTIVVRFWIIGIICTILSLVTLKIR